MNEIKKDNTEDKILNAAQEVFIQKGMDGTRMQEIADLLFISLQTVKDHVSRIYRKTGVRNRVQLMALLTGRSDRGVVPDESPGEDESTRPTVS